MKNRRSTRRFLSLAMHALQECLPRSQSCERRTPLVPMLGRIANFIEGHHPRRHYWNGTRSRSTQKTPVCDSFAKRNQALASFSRTSRAIAAVLYIARSPSQLIRFSTKLKNLPSRPHRSSRAPVTLEPKRMALATRDPRPAACLLSNKDTKKCVTKHKNYPDAPPYPSPWTAGLQFQKKKRHT